MTASKVVATADRTVVAGFQALDTPTEIVIRTVAAEVTTIAVNHGIQADHEQDCCNIDAGATGFVSVF